MNKIIAALILGIVSFLIGPLGLIFSIIGFILAIKSLKLPGKDIAAPFGYKGKVGNKKVSAQPFFSSKYLTYIAIGINAWGFVSTLMQTVITFFIFNSTHPL